MKLFTKLNLQCLSSSEDQNEVPLRVECIVVRGYFEAFVAV